MTTDAFDIIKACPEADVEERKLTYVEEAGKNFLLTRVAGEVIAFRNLCKHQFLVMEGCDLDEDSFGCPYHTVRYFFESGAVKDDSGFMGIQGLTRYPTRVVDGVVFLEVPRNERF